MKSDVLDLSFLGYCIGGYLYSPKQLLHFFRRFWRRIKQGPFAESWELASVGSYGAASHVGENLHQWLVFVSDHISLRQATSPLPAKDILRQQALTALSLFESRFLEPMRYFTAETKLKHWKPLASTVRATHWSWTKRNKKKQTNNTKNKHKLSRECVGTFLIQVLGGCGILKWIKIEATQNGSAKHPTRDWVFSYTLLYCYRNWGPGELSTH